MWLTKELGLLQTIPQHRRAMFEKAHTKKPRFQKTNQGTDSQHSIIIQVSKDGDASTAVTEFIAKASKTGVGRMAEELRRNPHLIGTIPIPTDSDLQMWLDRHLKIRRIQSDRIAGGSRSI